MALGLGDEVDVLALAGSLQHLADGLLRLAALVTFRRVDVADAGGEQSWTKLGSTSQLDPMPSRVTTCPVLPRVIVGNVGAAAARARSAAAIAAAPVAAAVLRKRRRLPPQVPRDPSIVTAFRK